MSVDTYARKASFRGYKVVRDQGVELLVSEKLLANASAVILRRRKFLWFNWLTTYAQLVGHASCGRNH